MVTNKKWRKRPMSEIDERNEVITKAAEGAKKVIAAAIDTMKEVTVDGYTFKFDGEKIDDVEVIERVAKIEEGQTAEIIKFVKFLIGDDGYTEMKNFFVTKEGKFKLSTLMKIFEAIFKEFDPKG